MTAAQYALARRISRLNRRIGKLRAIAAVYPGLEARSLAWMERLRDQEERLLRRMPPCL